MNVTVTKDVIQIKREPNFNAKPIGAAWMGVEFTVDQEMTNDQGQVWYKVSGYVAKSNTIPGDGNPPPPPPPETVLFEITAEKSLARFIYGYNAAGKPIMMIYPSEVADPSLRIKYMAGEQVVVYPTQIKADGGEYYVEIVSPPVSDRLYLQVDTGVFK